MRDVPERGLLTSQEVADLLRVTPSTVGRWRQEGLLQGIRVGRRKLLYKTTEVQRLLTELEAS